MGSWNSFLWPLVVLRSPELQTLPVGARRAAGPVHDAVGHRHGRLRRQHPADARDLPRSPRSTSSRASPTPASSSPAAPPHHPITHHHASPLSKEIPTMRTTALATVGIAAVAALALSGCAARQPADSGDRSRSRYTNFISNGGNEENLQTIVDAFEEENPDITVEVDDAAVRRLLHRAADRPRRRHRLRRVRHRVRELRASTRRTACSPSCRCRRPERLPPERARGVPDRRHAVRAAELVLDGRAVLQPDLFDAAGLEYPTADWTWADEQAAAEQLTDKAAGVWGDHQPVQLLRVLQGARAERRRVPRRLRHEGRLQHARGHRGRRMARRQERHGHADDRAGPGHARLRHASCSRTASSRCCTPASGCSAPFADAAVRLGHRGRARQHAAGQRAVLERGRRRRPARSTSRPRRSSRSS